MNLEDIYTPLDIAKKELEIRWNDQELKEKVEEFLLNDIPDLLKHEPKAFLARHISSPNFEFMRFTELANEVGLDYVLSEILTDKYLSINSLKRHLGKMFYHDGVDKNNRDIFVPHRMVDFNKVDGKIIANVETVYGNRLVDIHHHILYGEFPGVESKLMDISEWVDRNGKYSHVFYVKFLALFMRNGILFENFLLNSEERIMTEEVIMPSILFLKEKFGIKPLIVRLLPKETENDESWCYYSKNIKNYINDINGKNC